jgi:DNA-binding transcriptional LysR family regulator
MDRPPLTLDQLRSFWVVAERGSISHATRLLALTQSAVSRQIQALERALGVRLFAREGRTMSLTDAGRVLQEHARQVFGAVTQACEAVDAVKGLERGHLRVGAASTIGTYLLPGPLGAFKRAHPAIDVALEVANKARTLERLLTGEIDLGFVGAPLDAKDLVAEPWVTDDLGLITAPSHPLAAESRAAGGSARVRARDLTAEVFIVREAGSGTREIVEEELARAGIEMRRTMEMGSTEAIKQAVAANLGVSIVSRYAVTLETLTGRLWFAALSDLRLVRQLYVVHYRRRPPSRACAAFLDLVRRETPARKTPRRARRAHSQDATMG